MTVLKPAHCLGCPLYNSAWVPSAGSKPATILLVGANPTYASPTGSVPFQDRTGVIITTAIHRVKEFYQAQANGSVRWNNMGQFRSYGVRCVTEDTPHKTVLDKCRAHLEQDIIQTKPKVIITFGAQALKSVLPGLKAKFDEVRGTIIRGHIQQPLVEFDVCPTYAPGAIMKTSGLFPDFIRDLNRAWLHAEGHKIQQSERYTEEFLRSRYTLPQTADEVEAVCKQILEYSNEGEPASQHLISVDTETSMLEAHNPDVKIIMISFAWAPLKATSFFIDHPKRPWELQDRERVVYWTKQVLGSAKPKVLHNDKFDRQMVIHRYGWPLENVVWDTMLGEHLLEEDKKGQYGLKVLTRVRLPAYAGYDDKVAELREEYHDMTQAQAGKQYEKDLEAYQQAKIAYTDALPVYEHKSVLYRVALEQWAVRNVTEKQRAEAARKAKEKDPVLRKVRKDIIGPKPRAPRMPKEPLEPVKQTPFDFTLIPLNDIQLYAAIDADVTRQHVIHQNKRFNTEYARDVKMRQNVKGATLPPKPVKSLMREHAIPTSESLAAMEFAGFPIDLKYLEDLDEKLKNVLTKTETELYALAGESFNIESSHDLIRTLFQTGFDDGTGKRVIVPLTDDIARTPKGALKSDEKALLYIANTYGYNFPKKILTYRKANKARNPFITNMRQHALIDGCMHPTFNIHGTATGRSSSAQENMQNIPKKLAGFNIKDMFIPPKGYVLIDTDAKGAELRIFAAYSRDERLIKSIQDGLDTHSFMTAHIFGYTYEEVEDARRMADELEALKKDGKPFDAAQLQAASAIVKKRTSEKRVIFGLLYGAAAPKISETAGIPLQEAQEVIDMVFKMFPTVLKYIEQTQQEIMLFQHIYTFTGRKRRFPVSVINSLRSRCFRQGVNFKIQGTSSDIILWVLNHIAPVILNDLRGKLHATVHDSIVFSTPPQYISQITDLMHTYGTEHVKEHCPWLPVDFLWDISAGLSYGSCINIDKFLKDKIHEIQNRESEEDELISDDEIREEYNLAAYN